MLTGAAKGDASLSEDMPDEKAQCMPILCRKTALAWGRACAQVSRRFARALEQPHLPQRIGVADDWKIFSLPSEV